MRRHIVSLAILLFVATAASAMAGPSGAVARPSALAARVHLGPIVFAEDVQAGKPVRPGTTFKSGLSRIYGVLTFRGLRSDDRITENWYRNDVRWYWNSDVASRVFGNITEANSGYLRLWWAPDEKYVPGQYRLDVLVNGEVLQRGSFAVK